MITKEDIRDLLKNNSNVLSSDGEKIGAVGTIYADDDTNEPTWVTVNTGLFGNSGTFVPLEGASFQGEDILIPYSRDLVKDAPRVDMDGHLEPDEEDRLYTHYQLSGAGTEAGTGTGTGTERSGGQDAAGTVGRDTSGPTTDDAMTRSEERLNVGTEKQATSRARLRKYVTTENVTQTIPVQREEVRIEREPITDANRGAALDGPDFSEEEHVVTLHEERPVVEKEAVPVERVRLGKETVTDDATVNEEVRKENIDTDGTGGTRR